MGKPVDWDALNRLFQPRAQRAAVSDLVTYNGEKMPRWLARDLMQERAAIREYDGGLSRVEAEELTRKDLEQSDENTKPRQKAGLWDGDNI